MAWRQARNGKGEMAAGFSHEATGLGNSSHPDSAVCPVSLEKDDQVHLETKITTAMFEGII